MNERLIRIRDVEHLVGLKKTAIYDRIKKGEFPAPVKLGERVSVWRETQVSAWIEETCSRH